MSIIIEITFVFNCEIQNIDDILTNSFPSGDLIL
jgi:hypothetical protein